MAKKTMRNKIDIIYKMAKQSPGKSVPLIQICLALNISPIYASTLMDLTAQYYSEELEYDSTQKVLKYIR